LDSDHLHESIGGACRSNPVEGEERQHAADDAPDDEDDDKDFASELDYYKLVD